MTIATALLCAAAILSGCGGESASARAAEAAKGPGPSESPTPPRDIPPTLGSHEAASETPTAATTNADTVSPIVLPTFDPRDAPRWIAAASGAVPELNQVSLEQDIALAAAVFGEGGRVLFGSGPGTATVQVLGEARDLDPVAVALGDLFSPRGGRQLRYRPTRLEGAEPATADTVLAALDHALAGGPDPLLVYLGGHGNIGEEPRLNTVSLWEQSEISVADVAQHLDRSPRPVRLVVTTCFSGGFAELVFHEADAAQGATSSDRCGFFAAPWDLEATGCDPNPDRAEQQGYGLHFLHALRGQDRTGAALPSSDVDFDGDGSVSLLEAHTRVRISSSAADVPTSTTERWLRHAAPPSGPERAVALPEEDAVIETLSAALGLVGRPQEAYLELQRLGADVEGISRRLDDAQRQEDAAYRRAAASLLARWPVLDDPWHPDQPRVIETQRVAIGRHLETSASYVAYLGARQEVDRLLARLWELRLQAAPYERLTRALDNRKLAARLAAAGGEPWTTYERLLACERTVP